MRWRTALVTFMAVLLFAVSKTTASEPRGFSYGLIQRSCAPWDGPALELTLTTKPGQCKRLSGPYIEIGVWRGLPIRTGQSVSLDLSSETGYASRCLRVGDCQRAKSGSLVFEKYQDHSSSSGHYELAFSGGETLKGAFEAKWCESQVICR